MYELKSARYDPACGEAIGVDPEVLIAHAPAVPATCADAQPEGLSNPLLKSVVGPALAAAVKLIPGMSPPLTVTDWLAGENV